MLWLKKASLPFKVQLIVEVRVIYNLKGASLSCLGGGEIRCLSPL